MKRKILQNIKSVLYWYPYIISILYLAFVFLAPNSQGIGANMMFWMYLCASVIIFGFEIRYGTCRSHRFLIINTFIYPILTTLIPVANSLTTRLIIAFVTVVVMLISISNYLRNKRERQKTQKILKLIKSSIL